MAWIAPDDVLPRALRTLVARATGNARLLLVRDARGRVRVAADRGAVSDLRGLEEDLAAAIGAWFAGPVVDGGGSPAHRRIAGELLREHADWPPDWPREVELPDGRRTAPPRWLLGRVVLQSKDSWLGPGGGRPPDVPHVVSFYSFKGGVGRTTTLACVAARLAAERRLKVVAIDLDLEAPGLGGFLGARAASGVLDHVLSYVATGEVGDVAPEPVEGFEGLFVLPAGRLGPGYLEKLARLDYLAGTERGEASPAEAALRALLQAVAERVAPQVVLLDSRAGLHDLGGLALHRLSHTDLLLARAGAQARDGLRLVLDAVCRLRPAEERNVRMVQTMIPLPFDSDLSRPVVEQWRRTTYDLCRETIYRDLEETPQLDQETAHHALLVGYRDELTRTDSLAQLERGILPHFDPIADVVAPPRASDED